MSDLESLGDVLRRMGFDVTADALEEAAPACPEGCASWCRGRGSRRAGSTFVEGAAGEYRPLAEALAGITYDYCPCPAGVAAQARHQEARRVLDAALAQRAAARIWETAEVPPKLRRYVLESAPAVIADPALGALLRQWQDRDRAWLWLWGGVGTNKTGLAVSLLMEALAAGGSGLYVPMPTFLDRIRATYDRAHTDGGPGETDVMRSAVGVDLLVLDDLGKVPLTAWGREKLFTLVNERDVHERRTIVTTNLAPDQLGEHVGDATLDRIRGNAKDAVSGESFVIEMSGASSR